MDQDVLDYEETQNQASQKTPEQLEREAEQAELQRLRDLARRFEPLSGIAESLEADPSRIFAIRAAMEGRAPEQSTQQQQAQPQQRQLTPEEIAILNARALENPAEFIAQAIQVGQQQQYERFIREASPIIGTTADLFIETFKSNKSSQDSLYKQIAPLFEREMADVDRQTLLGKTPAQRARDLELRWQAAAAQVFRKAAAEAPDNRATNIGGGGTQGQQQTRKKSSVFERQDMVQGLTQRLIDQGLLSKEDLAELESEIEKDNS